MFLILECFTYVLRISISAFKGDCRFMVNKYSVEKS